MTRASTILSLLFSLSLVTLGIPLLPVSAVCQNITGAQIPDRTAQFLYFQSLNSLPADVLHDNLTNNVRLQVGDVDAVAAVLDDFKAKNNAAIDTYHHAVGVRGVDAATFVATADAVNDNTSAFNSLASTHAALAADTLGALKANVSPAGFARLEKAIQASKTSMTISGPSTFHSMSGMAGGGGGFQCNGMNPNYSTVQTITTHVISFSPVHATEQITWTLSGTTQVSGSNCNLVYHTGNINLYIGGVAGSNGAKGPASTYFNFSASVVLDNLVNHCLDPTGNGTCGDSSLDSMYCSFIGANIYTVGSSQPVKKNHELASTFTRWTNEKDHCATGLSGVTWCDFWVNNYCTPGTTPPDFNMDGQDIYDTNGHQYWWAYSWCTTTNIDAFGRPHQPYLCTYGFDNPKDTYSSVQACTSHP
jgi:hypothetical protein